MKAKGHINYARPLPWGQAASELLRVEDSGEWKKRFPSFSFYLEELAKAKKKTKSSFWRLRTSGRYYNELRKKLDPTGEQLPVLEDPRVKAAPESLELLGKISRVAPRELVNNLECQAMAGEISRGGLRDIWKTYRPVLSGKTARGRKQAPRYNRWNATMRGALTEANTLAPIVQGGPTWLAVRGKPYVYKVVHVYGSETLRRLYPSTPDVVVLLAEKKDSPLDLHGVEAGFNIEDNTMLQGYDRDHIGLDFLWFATSKRLDSQELADVPQEIGVLFTTPAAVEVVRLAERICEGKGRVEREQLLRALLCEASRSGR